jgi:hypothetical protein
MDDTHRTEGDPTTSPSSPSTPPTDYPSAPPSPSGGDEQEQQTNDQGGDLQGGDDPQRTDRGQEKPKAVADASDLPQGKTMPSRSQDDDSEVVIRDDVALAGDIRTVTDAGADVGEAEVQATADRETEAGFRGAAADPTPNEHYTVAGVTSGKPTPETHMGQRRAAKDNHTLDEGVESY